MTLFEIAGLYIALNAILFFWLTARVILVRRRDKISLGDNDDRDLRIRIRSQGNFAETAPMAMIGLIAIAALSGSPLMLHLFGGLFFLGRLLHAHGMMQKHAIGSGRPIGMMMTGLVILGQAFYILYLIFMT